MFRDFASFLGALWRETVIVVSGGSLFVLLTIWNMAGRKPLPQNINWLILGLTFILAAFAAWRKEWMESGKDFVSVSPQELNKLFRSGTGILAKSLLRPYIGKRLKFTGAVQNINKYVFNLFLGVNLWSEDGVSISFMAPFWRMGQFIPLPKDTRVTIIGRICGVSNFGIELKGCNLIGSTQPAVAQSPTPDP